MDKELDKFVRDTGVVFVKSAGNKGTESGNVTSPGKGLNVITVGNVKTKSGFVSALDSPYDLSASSSYVEASYLPNKPDIVAPGMYFSCMGVDGSIEYMGSGTSFAAPVVTGIIAQMMQAHPSMRGNPTAVKAALLLGADDSKTTTKDNNKIAFTDLREKSGAGFVNAINAVTNAFSSIVITFTPDSDEVFMPVESLYLEKGDVIDVVMAVSKRNEKMISSENDLDNIDLWLMNSDTGEFVEAGYSDISNIEMFKYTITESGYYEFWVDILDIVDLTLPPEVSIVYNVE